MKPTLFSIFLLLISTSSFGQIKYEKGYFIDNDNRKTECLIKNEDWKDNPVEFKYMLENSGILEKGNIVSVKEFCIYGFSKFIRANVKIDRSSNDIDKLEYGAAPFWSQEQLFLKALVEGKASLYSYDDDTLNRFFYSVADTSINQLIYKKYLVDNMNVAKNNTFQQQLLVDVRCANTNISSLENIMYTRKDLEEYFLSYSKCSGDSIMLVYNNKVKRDLFNLIITAGFNVSTMSLSNALNNTGDVDFNTNISFRLGVESELILPFYMNKWGIIIEPTFQYYISEKIHNNEKVTVQYRAIEFPIGVRYYFFFNEDIKGFLNGFYISNFSLNFNSKIIYNHLTTLDISPRTSFAFGGGLVYKRISAEIRYYPNRELSDYVNWSIKHNMVSLIFGYNLMKTRHKPVNK